MNTPTGTTHVFGAVGSLFRKLVSAHRQQTDMWEQFLYCPRSAGTAQMR
jgi:hypothetical protein